MADMQPDFSASVGVNLTRTLATHLASEAVTVQHFGAEFGRNGASEADGGFFGRLIH